MKCVHGLRTNSVRGKPDWHFGDMCQHKASGTTFVRVRPEKNLRASYRIRLTSLPNPVSNKSSEQDKCLPPVTRKEKSVSDKTVYGWHFLYEGHKLRTGEDAPADGVWLEVPGKPRLCSHGLHGSIQPFDALSHAPGPILTLCEFAGEIAYEADKLVAQRRRIIARMDATEMLRYFARMQALSVGHLWNDMPDVVADFLMTGDESIRDAAMDAAWSVARDAAMDAAWSAARAAAWDAARAAAMDAAWAAAWDAARDAARAAAWDAARAAAMDAARREFNHLVCECFEGPLSSIEWSPQ